MDKIRDDSERTRKLLEQAHAGDPEAVEQLFEHHRPYLRQLIEARLDAGLRQRVDASDVVQETQSEAAGKLKEFLEAQPVPFHLWLRQIARNRLLKARGRHIEAAKRAAVREVQLPERSSLQLAKQLIAGGSTPSQHVSKKELVQCVRQALARLQEADREILLMRNFEQLSFAEIGYILEIDPAAARKRHGRALLRLIDSFNQNSLTGSQV